jgi:hypothetical protein
MPVESKDSSFPVENPSSDTSSEPKRTAAYLVGHGSKANPRLIELQYQRIIRYHRAFVHQFGVNDQEPAVYLDLRLPRVIVGAQEAAEIPGFAELCRQVEAHKIDVVYLDLDEAYPEAPSIRSWLIDLGATVLNACTDDKGAFERELQKQHGKNAHAYEVTEASDFINFFPSLASDVIGRGLSRELEESTDKAVLKVRNRVNDLKKTSPYSGGKVPFVEPRLTSEWTKMESGE